MKNCISAKIPAILLSALATAFTVSSHAEILVSYNFGTSSSTTLSATVEAAGLSGSDISNSQFVLPLFGVNTSLGYSSDPVLSVAPNTDAVDAASAVTNDSYFRFTITPTVL